MVWNPVANIKGPKGDKGAGSTTFAVNPPLSPQPGDTWVDTSDPGTLVQYTYIADADGAQWVELGSGGLAPNTAAVTHAALSKATPVNADEIPLIDSAAGFILRRLTWANLRAGFLSVIGSWSAAQTFAAGAALGEQGTVLKRKIVVVTAPALNGAATSAAHGLTRSKIRSIVVTSYGTGYSAGADYQTNAALRFSAWSDNNNCYVNLAAGEGGDVAGKPIYFSIEYEP